MKLVKRTIEVAITLATGDFGNLSGQTVAIKGFRINCNINVQGGDAQGVAEVNIYGLPLSLMNQLISIGPVHTELRLQNKIVISAGDEGDTLAVVFSGVINTSVAQMNAAPDVCVTIIAQSATDAAMLPVTTTNFAGSVDVAGAMNQFSKDMGYAFHNSGVTAKLSNHSFNGTTLDKIRECAHAANIDYSIDRGRLAIWNLNSHTNDETVYLSPKSGLVGYPAFNSNGVALKSIFIKAPLHIGQQVKVSDSEITAVNGTWTISWIIHNLSCQTPNGQWFTELQVSNLSIN